MGTVSLVRAMLAEMLLQPIGIFAVLGLCCAGPALLALAPIGITSNAVGARACSKELALMGLATGIWLATGSLDRLGPLLVRRSSGWRLFSDLAALACGGTLGGLLALLPLILVAKASSDLLGLEHGPACALALLAAAAAGAVVLRLRLAEGLAPGMLAVVFVLAPIVLPQPARTHALASLASALLASAWLLDHPPGRPT